MDSKTFFSYGYVRILITLTLIGVIIALGAYAYLALREARYINTGPATISVQGVGEVFAKPDVGEFTFTVQTEGENAADAQQKGSEAMDTIVAYLSEKGVEERDIKTTSYNLNQKYRYEERVCAFNAYCPPSNPIPDGFEVYQSVSVKARNLDAAGELIAGVGERGATNISGLQFTIDEDDVFKAQAREQAIADARAKAEVLADNLGVRLGRMFGYWEETNDYYPYPMGYGGAEMDAAFAREESMKAVVPTGENTFTSRINITYEIR